MTSPCWLTRMHPEFGCGWDNPVQNMAMISLHTLLLCDPMMNS